MTDGMGDMLSAALVLASRGWPVFPCGSAGDKAKQPLTPHGFKDATTSEPTIRHWWGRWPDAAVGIPTGERSGFWALDVDTKHGKPGDDSLDLLERQHGRLPDTVEVLTASGGRHLWFAWDPVAEIRNSAEALGPGLDVRGEGGYVIAPPSLVDGRRYAFEGSSDPEDGVALAPAPDWLVERAFAHSRRPPSLASATTNDGAARITAGNRNDTLFRLASSLRAKGLNASAILAAIRAENLERCEPPLEDEEVDRIAESASKFEQGEIRTGTDGATVTSIGAARKARESGREQAREEARKRAVGLAGRYVFVAELNQWFDLVADVFLTREAVDAKHRAEFPVVRLTEALLTGGEATIVDSIGWQPAGPPVLKRGGRYVLNAWRDDGLPGKVGNVRPWLEHARYLVPANTEREHLLDWLAFVLQQPERKVNHQLVLGGRQGIGKDSLLQPVIRGVGPSNVSQPAAEELQQNFNSYIDRKKLVVFQEIHSFQRRDIENRIKPPAAAPPETIRINVKGVKQYEIPNLAALVFMTNHYGDAMSIAEGDRRYFCLWCPARPKPENYYVEFYQWLNDGGDAAVIQYLLERDLSRFNPAGLPPMTEWKRVLQGASAHGVEALVRELIEEERTPFDRDLVTVGEITKSWPLLDARRGVLPAALANVGAVHRRVHWKPPGDRARTRGIWILGNHDDYAEMLDAELGNKWLILGGQL